MAGPSALISRPAVARRTSYEASAGCTFARFRMANPFRSPPKSVVNLNPNRASEQAGSPVRLLLAVAVVAACDVGRLPLRELHGVQFHRRFADEDLDHVPELLDVGEDG